MYPKKLKVAKVIPIHKGGRKDIAGNYRPISLLSPLNKILEKVIAMRLTSFLTKVNFFSKKQFAYLKGVGTTIAITELVDKIYAGLDDSNIVTGLFIDFSKAFDCLSHDILINKLENAGIRGPCLTLIRSYLSERSQAVDINGITGEEKLLKYGVPQGSVLGPILFLVYVNDINQLELNGDIWIFADDTSLIYQSDRAEQNVHAMQSDIRQLEAYWAFNQLSANALKTTYVHFKSPNKNLDSTPGVIMHNTTIASSRVVKFLGVEIDQNLDWKTHILHVRKQLALIIGKLVATRKFLPSSAMKNVYTGLFQSKLLYGIESYGTAYKTNLECLQVAQNRVLKLMFKLAHLHPTLELYNKPDSFMPVRALADFRSLLLFFKIINGRTRTNLIFTRVSHQYINRRRSNYTVPQHRLNYGRKRLSVRAPQLWNNLRNEVSSIPATIIGFRSIHQTSDTLE